MTSAFSDRAISVSFPTFGSFQSEGEVSPKFIREVSPASTCRIFLRPKRAHLMEASTKALLIVWHVMIFWFCSIWGEGQPLTNIKEIMGGNRWKWLRLIISNRGSPCCYRIPRWWPWTRIRNNQGEGPWFTFPTTARDPLEKPTGNSNPLSFRMQIFGSPTFLCSHSQGPILNKIYHVRS